VIWLRHRREYDWQGIKVMRDYTQGYGYILELEQLVTSQGQIQSTKSELRQKLLNVETIETYEEELHSEHQDCLLRQGT
jgi:hypothetical protein